MNYLRKKCAYSCFYTDSFRETISLVDEYFLEKNHMSREEARLHLQRIRQLALDHIKEKQRFNNAQTFCEMACQKALVIESQMLDQVIHDIKLEEDVLKKEEMLMDWLVDHFVPSETRCTHCH